MTMADGGYDPMGHIQTGRPQASYYLYQVAAAALEQQQQLQQLEQQQQQQQRQQQQQQQQAAAAAASAAAAAAAAATADPPELSEIASNSTPPRSSPPSEDGHENNNNLPAAANNNLFRTEQHKKHKRKRLSAVLDKLHNGGAAVVNHNNNNVGEGQPFKLKCTDSRSSAEDSATEDVFPYSASPRISISPLRLSEVDENQPLQQQQQQRLPAVKQEAGALVSATQLIIPPHGYDQQLPSPSQLHQAKLEAQLQRLTPLQPTQIKQEQQDPQQLYKQLQYFNPLALFNCLPEPTKLLYQEFARQRSHSDSDLQQQQPQQQQQQQQHKKQQGQARQQSTKQPSKKKRLNGGKAIGAGAASQQRQRPPTSSSRCSNASSNGAPHDPQEHPLDLSMKSTGSGSGMSLLDSPSLLASPVIKQEPKLADSPPPPPPLPPSRDSPLPALQPPPPKLIVKREDCRDRRRSSPYEQLNGYGHHHGATVTGGPGSGPGGAPGFNLNVSPVVEEMPPGSDVAYMCPVCGQLFSLQDRLAKHMASRHKSRTGPTDITKSYMCEVCHRSFARSDMLTRHMRLHTGVKPYSCKVCGQIFSRSDHLSTHQRTHTGEKPYKCPQCPYAACRRDMITRHMRTHTRYDSQRGSGGLGGGIGIGPGGDGGSPLMDQKPLLLPMVSLGTGRSMKKQVSFGGVPTSYVLEAKTES